MEKYCVYAIICPIINEVIYIGITRSSFWNLKYRLTQHFSEFSFNKEKNKWIKKIKRQKQYPIGIILSFHKNKEMAFKNEIKTINFFRNKGINLLNIYPKIY